MGSFSPRPRCSNSFLDDRVGHVFGGSRRHRGFDQHQATGVDLFADDLEALLQGGDVGVPLAHLAEALLVVVALDVDDDHVGQAQHIVSIGGDQILLLLDAAPDHRRHLRVFGLDRRDAAVQVGDFPVRARRRPLHADDELVARALFGRRVGHHPGHDRPHEPHPHHDHDFAALLALLLDDPLQAFEFLLVIGSLRQGESLALGADGNSGVVCRFQSGRCGRFRYVFLQSVSSFLVVERFGVNIISGNSSVSLF